MIECYNIKAKRRDGDLDIPYLVLPNVGVVAVYGPPQSGKATLLKVLADITEYRGKIRLDDGLKLHRYSANFVYDDFTYTQRYCTPDFRQTLDNVMALYGLKDRIKVHERAINYLRQFDLTENDNYENLERPRRALFTLALLLALDRPVLLLDGLFAEITSDQSIEVTAALEKYAESHLVIFSAEKPVFSLKLTRALTLDKGRIKADRALNQEKLRPVRFRKNQNFNLQTFTLLPHLKTRAKIVFAVLAAVFTFTVSALAAGLAPNLAAFNELRSESFANVRTIHSGYEERTYANYSNRLVTLRSLHGEAQEFFIRPLLDDGKIVTAQLRKVTLSKKVAKVLAVSPGSIVSVAGIDFEVAGYSASSRLEVCFSWPYFAALAQDLAAPFYHLPAADLDARFFDRSGQNELAARAGCVYYRQGTVLSDAETDGDYGFYDCDTVADHHLALIGDFNPAELLASKRANEYVVYYRDFSDLKPLAALEPASFVYNLYHASIYKLTSIMLVVFGYLVLALAILLNADKDDSTYYLAFSKAKFTFLQSLKYLTFTALTLLASLLLVVSLSRESLLLTLTVSTLAGTLVLLFILYLIIGRLSLKDW